MRSDDVDDGDDDIKDDGNDDIDDDGDEGEKYQVF